MNFAAEGYSQKLLEEMAPLWPQHYDEVALYKDVPFTPDTDAYTRMDEGGVLRIFTVRENDALVGYAVFVVCQHPHYKTSKQAVQDLLFLQKNSRKPMVGYRFLKWCDEQLNAEGVQVIFHHVTESKDFSPVLRSLGYSKHETVYSRRVA